MLPIRYILVLGLLFSHFLSSSAQSAIINHVPLEEMEALSANHLSSWHDEETAMVVAIVGLNNGVGFVEVSQPQQPRFMGKLPSHSGHSLFRESVVYKDHLYVISKAEHHGLQVFSLQELRKGSTQPLLFKETNHIADFGTAIHISINEQKERMYITGASPHRPFGFTTLCYSLTTPAQPVLVTQLEFENNARTVLGVTLRNRTQASETLLIAAGDQSIQIFNAAQLDALKLVSEIPLQTVAATNSVFIDSESAELFAIERTAPSIHSNESDFAVVTYDISKVHTPLFKKRMYGKGEFMSASLIGHSLFVANATAGAFALDTSSTFSMAPIPLYATENDGIATPFLGAWDIEATGSKAPLLVSDYTNGLYIIAPPTATMNSISNRLFGSISY
jgi:choice-of-anchor B domain-containing protein